MLNVPNLILMHGVERAKEMAQSKMERQCIDITAAMLGDDDGEIGISHSGFALTSLPHRAIQEALWIKEGHHITLHIASGHTRDGTVIGIPYGAKARMILLYLQTEALRSNSPEVELGRSMYAWLTRMGMPIGGATYRLVSEQAKRISSCRLTFFHDIEGGQARLNGAFVDTEISMFGTDGDSQLALWQDSVRLNDRFFKSLQEHSIPLRDEALRQLSNKSLALDIYTWLAYRLHVINKPVMVSWPALFNQFGSGYAALRQFKPKFRESLAFALAAYPEAKIDVANEGLILHQSRPPVEKQLVTIRKLG